MTLLEQLNTLPPPVARLLCPLTDEQIAKKSGLCRHTVMRISQCGSWDKYLATVSAYLEGCGIAVKITIPALKKVRRIANSTKGVDGLAHIRLSKGSKPWQKAARSRRIKSTIKALT